MISPLPSELISFTKFFEHSRMNGVYLLRLLRDERGILKDWKFEFCNETAARNIGMSLSDVLGRTYGEIRPGALEKNPDLVAFMGSLSKAGSEWRGVMPSTVNGRSYDCSLFSPKDDWIISIAKDLSQEMKEKDVFREAAFQSKEEVYYFEPVFDPDGKIEDFTFGDLNPAGEHHLKMGREEVLGKRLCLYFPYNLSSGLFDLYVYAYTSGESLEKEYTVPEGARAPGTYLVKVAKVHEGLLVSNSNITNLRNVEKEIRVQKELLESTYLASNDGYWDYDFSENKLFLSKRWKTMLGYEEAEISNEPNAWRKLVHPKDLRIALSAFERQRTEGAERFDKVLRFRKKDGEYLFVRSRAMIIFDDSGEPIRMVGTHTDISAAKETELALAKAKEAAEKSYNAKSEFLGMISHEMRTPLFGIAGMANLLSQTDLDELQKDYLKDLISSSNILSRLIDDLLQVVTLDAAKIEIRQEPFGIQNLIDMIRKLAEPRAKEKDLNLEIHLAPNVPEKITGDRTRIEQVLLNLLVNSVKFTDHGTVSLRIDLESPTSIAFTVRDTGIGIEDEARKRIFEAFHQEDLADARKYKGVGLGLYIAQKLVSLMKGEIRLESDPGRGSEFKVILPLHSPVITAPETKKIPQNSVPTFPSGRILVVDDNEINLKILSKHLSRTGVKTDSALSGFEALKILETEENKYDLIFLDLQMPGMDGYSTADAIRALKSSNSKIPIVAVTASSFSETFEKCAEHRIDGFIGKPFEPEQLYKVLSNYI
ncbi:hybrid sensor histidine kinase/response regulator [Leptospira wolffii]|uniref:hybrid sensor histidine kinase/response regulator n=1 Tax=Leptospira wolffii TaxID=409998 RepID=UPI0018DC6FE1|nr:hybrid sensor histidine kinase/response regulator [Leptospira wolffii]